MDSKHVSLPNLILGKELFPEMLQDRANAALLSQTVLTWHRHPNILREIRKGCFAVREKLGDMQSAQRFAEDFVREIV